MIFISEKRQDSEANADEDNRVGAIYCRVSTKEQVSGYSLDEQKRVCKKYLENMGFEHYRLYIDEGYTGKTLQRPRFQAMLDHCLQGKITHIIVWKLDRLSRNLRDTINLIEELDRMGIGVISVTQAIDSTTTLGKIVISVLSGFSQIELENLTERVILGVRARFKEGKWKGGTTPMGYSYDQESEMLVIDDDEAKVVRLIFKKYLELGALKRVANYLNNNEIPTRNEKRWQATTIRNILERETYAGVLKQGDVEKHLEELRIIEDDIFNSVKELLEERKRYAPHRKSKDQFYKGEAIYCTCGAELLEEMRYCYGCGIKQMTTTYKSVI